MQAAFDDLEKLVAAFETCRPDLTSDISMDKFQQIVSDLEGIVKLMQRIGGYAELWFTEDTQNQSAMSLLARMEQLGAEISNRILFFTLWWKELDDKNAERMMKDSGDLHYWLEEMRHFKPHTLSEAEEKIINIKDVTGSNALITLYDSFTNRYSFKINVKGEEKEVTRGELMSYVRMANPDLRAAAYQELYRVYGQDGLILGQMYQTVVRDWRNENINLRGYKSPISARNLGNDIPDEVVDTLLDVCQKNAPIFQRFFKLKARLLKMDKLRRYDIYAPVTESTKEFSMGSATELIMDSFDSFDPRFAQLAMKVISEKHVDSQVRKGKRSGRLLRHRQPGTDSLGADQLPGTLRRRGHTGARTRPRHPFPAGQRPQHLHPARLPAAGGDRLHLRRDDAGGTLIGRRTRRKCAARPALPPGG